MKADDEELIRKYERAPDGEIVECLEEGPDSFTEAAWRLLSEEADRRGLRVHDPMPPAPTVGSVVVKSCPTCGQQMDNFRNLVTHLVAAHEMPGEVALATAYKVLPPFRPSMWQIVLVLAIIAVIGGTLDVLRLRYLVWWLAWWTLLLLVPTGLLYVGGKLLGWWGR
jgi:hypothetical protein